MTGGVDDLQGNLSEGDLVAVIHELIQPGANHPHACPTPGRGGQMGQHGCVVSMDQ